MHGLDKALPSAIGRRLRHFANRVVAIVSMCVNAQLPQRIDRCRKSSPP
jgi:hypothetical protein